MPDHIWLGGGEVEAESYQLHTLFMSLLLLPFTVLHQIHINLLR